MSERRTLGHLALAYALHIPARRYRACEALVAPGEGRHPDRRRNWLHVRLRCRVAPKCANIPVTTDKVYAYGRIG